MRSIEKQRAAVVAEALSWQRTPWHHRGKVKGVGVDCAQFIICTYANAGVIEPIETGEYPRDWHIHKEEERFLNFCKPWVKPIREEAAKPGDLVIFKIGRVYSHGAIVVDYPQAIHASINDGCVTLCDLDRDVGLISDKRLYFKHRDW